MRFFSGVSNYRETPYIISDTFANKASYAATTKGALYIARDGASLSEPSIYQANGSLWVPIGSYGIGTDATLEDVTTNGNTTDKGIQITAGGLTTNSLTDTGLTAKSVPFVGTGGLITQDNTNFVWDNVNKWLGIQTNTPTAELDLHSTTSTPMLALNNTAGNPQNILFQNTNVSKWRLGNADSNTFTLFNNNLGVVAMSVKTTDNTFYVAGNLGINQSAPSYNLDVNGITNLGGVTNIQTGNNLFYLQNNGATTGWTANKAQNTGASFIFGLNGSAAGGIASGATAYATVLYSTTNLEFYSGSTKRFTLDTTGFATFSNRVNINGASDDGSTALNVSGRGIFTGDIITQGGILTANNGGSINVFNVGTTNYFDLKSTGGNFALRTNLGVSAVNALTIAATGAATFLSRININGALDDGSTALNVIGLSKLSGDLNLQGSATRNLSFYDNSNTNINAQIQYDQISANTGQLFFKTNNAGTLATKLTITAAGNVGIGGIGAAKLGVYGAIPANTYLLIDNAASGINYYAANNLHEFQTSGFPRLNITSLGNVLIGSTTDDTVTKLQVNGGISLASGANLTWGGAYNPGIPTIDASSVTGFRFYPNGITSGSTVNFKSSGVILFSNLAGTGSRTVLADASGNLSAPLSDQSIKENIQPLQYGLDTIMKLNPVQFEFIDQYKNYGQGLQIGNIAQEVEQIIPIAVFKTPSTGLKGIDYNQFHGIYIKAIQDQQKIIESLIERIEQLEIN